MDINLPQMSGYEVTEKIRSFGKNIPIIAQTANAMEGDRELALNAGCNDYIAKPIEISKLLEIIDSNIK